MELKKLINTFFDFLERFSIDKFKALILAIFAIAVTLIVLAATVFRIQPVVTP